MLNNDYSFLLRRVPLAEFAYHKRVSVIIPTYNQAPVLAKTLAAFSHQTYPLDLIQIVIADDGSSDNVTDSLTLLDKSIELKHVRQPHHGHRLSTVINLGVRASNEDSLILLQADMLPTPRLIESYMRLLHWIDEALLIGQRRFVDANTLSPAVIATDPDFSFALRDVEPENELWISEPCSASPRPDWRVAFYAGNNNLLNELWPFKAVVGSNLAFTRRLFESIGGFSSRFTAWGCEDGEFGYRAYNRGYYFIPVFDAIGLHQEPATPRGDSGRRRGYELTRVVRSDLCPVPPYRRPEADLSYSIPKISVSLHFATEECKANFRPVDLSSTIGTDAELIVVGERFVPESLRLQPQQLGLPVRFLEVRDRSDQLDYVARAAAGPYVSHVMANTVALLNAGTFQRLAKHLDQENIGCSTTTALGGQTIFLYRKRDWWRAGGFGANANLAQPESFLKILDGVCTRSALN